MKNYSFQYETEANASFLVAVFEKDPGLIHYQLRMQESNKIAHFLNIKKYQFDGVTRLCYNVTSKIPLSRMLERDKISKENLLNLLGALMETCRELPEYQLPASGLLLDEDYIFVNSESFEPSFVYLPLYTDDNLENVRQFVKKLIMDSKISSTNDGFVQSLLDLFNEYDLTVEKIQDWIGERKKEDIQRGEKESLVSQLKPPGFVLPDSEKPKERVEYEGEKEPKKNIPLSPQRNEGKARKNAKVKKEEKETHDAKPCEKRSSKKMIIFIAVQVVILLVVAFLVKQGFFVTVTVTELDSYITVNTSYIAGILLCIFGIDFVLYRELFLNNKKEMKARQKKKKPSSVNRKKEFKPSSGESKSPKAEINETDEKKHEEELPLVPVYVPVPIYSEEKSEGTVLMDDVQNCDEGYLEYYENGLATRIHLYEGTVRVGSLAHVVDHVLASKRVSKLHAEFSHKDNQYFVKDINSTNGIYLNGSKTRIVSNKDFELHNGDKVRLADVEMVFKC